MSAPQPQREGLSLSVKLILATVVLLCAAVGAGAFFSWTTVEDIVEAEAASRRAAGEEAILKQTQIQARNLAASAALPLAEGNFTYLKSLVERALEEDPNIAWILLADATTRRVVARTAAAPSGELLADDLVDDVAAASSGKIPWARDPADATRFTFGAPVRVGDQLVGQLRLSVTTHALEEELARSIAAARTRGRTAARNLLIVAGAILGLGILLAFVEGLRITRPVEALTAQAARIAAGDFAQRVEVSSRDEIGLLARSFNFMAENLGRLMSEVAGKAAMEREMGLARAIQEQMSPPTTLLTIGPLRIAGSCEMSAHCGGDWWTFRSLPGERALVVVGDVTGHGMPAAMIAATARGAAVSLANDSPEGLAPETVLDAIDRAIRDVGRGNLVMTCFAALIDPHQGIVEFANAGQTFPLLRRVEERHAAPRLTLLRARGNPLGDPHGKYYESGRVTFQPGDVLVLFTDGIIDRVREGGERFGEKRLRRLLVNRPELVQDGAAGVRAHIEAELRAFAGPAPSDDDMTIVVVEYAAAAQPAGLSQRAANVA